MFVIRPESSVVCSLLVAASFTCFSSPTSVCVFSALTPLAVYFRVRAIWRGGWPVLCSSLHDSGSIRRGRGEDEGENGGDVPSLPPNARTMAGPS